MQAITLNQAIQHFTEFMDEVNNNHEPLIITDDNHKTILMRSKKRNI